LTTNEIVIDEIQRARRAGEERKARESELIERAKVAAKSGTWSKPIWVPMYEKAPHGPGHTEDLMGTQFIQTGRGNIALRQNMQQNSHWTYTELILESDESKEVIAKFGYDGKIAGVRVVGIREIDDIQLAGLEALVEYIDSSPSK
jgi:hypothetical protein